MQTSSMTEGNKQFLLVSNAMEMERVGRLGGLGEKALQTVVSAFSGSGPLGRHRWAGTGPFLLFRDGLS